MADNYDTYFQQAGDQYGIDPDLLKAQAMTESGLDPNATGPQTAYGQAQGISQIIPATAKALGADVTDPKSSIMAQAKLMVENQSRYQDQSDAIAAYHGGTNTDNWGPKTKAYVDKVTKAYESIKAAKAQVGQDVAQESSGSEDNSAGDLAYKNGIPSITVRPQGSSVKPASPDALEPMDDFEAEALGKPNKNKVAAIIPQDDFEKEVLATAPQDDLEKEAMAPGKVPVLDQSRKDYQVALEKARALTAPNGSSLTAGIPGQLAGMAINAESQVPFLHEATSGIAATLGNINTPSKIPEAYNHNEQVQQALAQAASEQNPGANNLVKATTGLSTALLAPAQGANAAAGLGTKMAAGAAAGAGYGALYGAGTGDASLSADENAALRKKNAERSAVFGGVVGGAMPAAVAAGRGVANMVSGGTIDPAVAQLAKTAADKYGIDIPGGLLSDNPGLNKTYSSLNRLGLTGKDPETVANATKAISNTFGENTAKLDRDTMEAASTRIGGIFDQVAQNVKGIKVDNSTLNELARIEKEAGQIAPGDERVTKQIDNILEIASKNNGEIPSEQWQYLIGTKSPLSKIAKTGNDPVAEYAGDIKSALVDALKNSAKPEDKAMYDEARKQYKNFMTVSGANPDPITGSIDLTKISNQVSKTVKKYGKTGLENLQELGDIGSKLRLSQSSNTAENHAALNWIAKLGTAAETGLAFNDPVLAAKIFGTAAATAGAGRAAGAALSSDWYRNRLIQNSLQSQLPGNASRLVNGLVQSAPIAYEGNKLLSLPASSSSVQK